MPETSEKEERKVKEKSPDLTEGMSPWKVTLGQALWKWMAGGASLGSLVTVINTTKLPEIALGGLAGGALTGAGAIGYAFINPVGKKVKEGAEAAGNATAGAMGNVAKKALIDRPFEDQYWECQALECTYAKSIGIKRYSDIFIPLLEKVFIELGLDGRAQMAGLHREDLMDLQQAELSCDRLQIWDLLRRAEKNPQFRCMALLAWGGYGKTTLMRHVAYMYGKNKQGRGIDRKLPVLIILGKHRELLSSENPPDLATFIEKHHIPSLPGGADLVVPQGWAKDALKQGRVVVMLDGLDEIPLRLRSNLVDWINQQVNRHVKSIFILTSRPKAYGEASSLEFPMTYWVQEFDDGQRRDFIERWYLCQEVFAHGGQEDKAVRKVAQEAADDLYGQIQRRSELRDMAKNPLLLTMMTTFHRRNNGADLPKRQVELYQDICQLQLKDRPGARKLESALLNCNAQEILQPLALEMMVNHGRLIKKEALLKVLRKTLAERSETIEAEDFLGQVTEVGELLIQQEDEYEFSHLSFQEYLAAVEIVRSNQETLLHQYFNLSGDSGDSWSRLMLMYVCLVNPTSLIRKAIEQGRADLADKMYRETTKQVDPALKIQLEQALKKVVQASKYVKLSRLLEDGKWKEADEETYRLMITTVGKEEGQLFDLADLKNFPCEDLLEIDRLWVEASNGHFGFSVQKKIWQKYRSPMDYNDDYNKFMEEVGWRNPKFSISNSSRGELPCAVAGLGLVCVFRDNFRGWFFFLAQRLVNCSATRSVEISINT
jgi:predicted NACHT family NTPase